MKYIVPIESRKSTLLVVDANTPEEAKQIILDRVMKDYQYAVDVFAPVLFDSVNVGDPTVANFVPQEECNENHADYPICPRCGFEKVSEGNSLGTADPVLK